MEVKNHVQPIKNPSAFLERKVDPRSTKFMQALADAMEPAKPAEKQITDVKPAALARLVSPRSTMELRSLNPVETLYSAKPAALEKIGKSRVVPFVIGGAH
ncbi:MAG TPA: hypothetical protein VGC62_11085 [Pseudomonas sp.]|uniref:hypothetical protein n=1 Tax=Pseudomonas sp. TaxID=306 RepID=UPI002ED8A88B